MCEVWNSKIVEFWDKPILTMLEELRCYIMRRMGQHKVAMRNWKEKLLHQLIGLPCEHAIAAITFNFDGPEDYVHHSLTLDVFNVTYSYVINPVSKNKKPRPDPIKLKRPIGRPKKQRRRDVHSEATPSSSPKNAKESQVGSSTTETVRQPITKTIRYLVLLFEDDTPETPSILAEPPTNEERVVIPETTAIPGTKCSRFMPPRTTRKNAKKN
ncbi:hypothetical protein Lal_00011000 [Lupinus albus]|nr:hypothetical protein Lal_00011000 [Lupinus albus]